jgi:uncharacterized protein with von Willebrand factor type A (vWA) domain
MSERAKKIVEQVLELPESEQRLVENLLREARGKTSGDDAAAVANSWREELKRRAGAVHAGIGSAVSMEEYMHFVNRLLGE